MGDGGSDGGSKVPKKYGGFWERFTQEIAKATEAARKADK